MTLSPATTPPCLGHLRLELPLSSFPRKVTILDMLVAVAHVWGARVETWDVHALEYVCVYTYMRNVSEYDV